MAANDESDNDFDWDEITKVLLTKDQRSTADIEHVARQEGWRQVVNIAVANLADDHEYQVWEKILTGSGSVREVSSADLGALRAELAKIWP